MHINFGGGGGPYIWSVWLNMQKKCSSNWQWSSQKMVKRNATTGSVVVIDWLR